MTKWLAVFLIVFLLLTACGTQPPASSPEMPTPAPSPSALPPTWTPPPAPTQTPLPSPTPFLAFEAEALTDFLNVRANPGYLFEIQTQLDAETKFQVLGKSPGGEWIYVELADGSNGWIFNQLISSVMDLQLAPIREPQDVQLITGSVADASGKPVNGIQFMVQGAGASAPRTDALTDDTGTFYAYLPSAAAGKWYVSFAAISCTSVTMDKDCNCLGGVCGTINPAVKNVTLPQTEPLEFLWQ